MNEPRKKRRMTRSSARTTPLRFLPSGGLKKPQQPSSGPVSSPLRMPRWTISSAPPSTQAAKLIVPWNPTNRPFGRNPITTKPTSNRRFFFRASDNIKTL